jgi:predicted GNAT family acetyltransferase
MSHVIDNPGLSRFEMPVPGGVAFVAYRRVGHVLFLDHAEVPAHLNGRGLGSQLVRGTLEAIRAAGRDSVIARCSFVRRYMAEHPEFDDITARP